jgi:hypothetical protein
MDLKETEARNDCTGESQQQLNQLTKISLSREAERVSAVSSCEAHPSEVVAKSHHLVEA